MRSRALFLAIVAAVALCLGAGVVAWSSLNTAMNIEQGGTTLNDFANADGESGYFQVSLQVYGREGDACMRCGATVRRIVQSGRSTFYCPRCQR